MRKFRVILTLLLCLTVPAAGWAAALTGTGYSQHHPCVEQEPAAHHHPGTHHSGTRQLGLVASNSGHCHHHCAGVADHDKTCNGEHCACGCGIGACAAPALSPLGGLPAAFMRDDGSQVVPQLAARSYADTRDTSPLRPPIC